MLVKIFYNWQKGDFMSYIIVLCTTESPKQAKIIGSQLVREELAACVNIVPKMTSIYRWEGKIMEDDETILLIKTQSTLFEKIKTRIIELHTYDLPEIVALNITNANKAYLNWIDKETISPNERI